MDPEFMLDKNLSNNATQPRLSKNSTNRNPFRKKEQFYCRTNQKRERRNTLFRIDKQNTNVYTSLELTLIDRPLVY